MANKSQNIVIRGELNWAKLLGKARPYDGNPKYDKGPYWSVDVTPDKNSREVLRKAGILNKLREPSEKDSRTESFLTLKVLQNKKDGSPNLDNEGKQITPKVQTVRGEPWNDGLIGNGSIADIKINVVDYEGTTGVYYQVARILKHEKFEGGADFAPLSEDDEFFSQRQTVTDDSGHVFVNPDDLEDEIPF
jgi:hypothetical protein